jgi:trigger factor
MTDKPRPEGHPEPAPVHEFQTPSTAEVHVAEPEPALAPPATAATAVAAPEPPAEDGEEKPKPLTQTVDIKDVGPCKKHIKVAIARENIEDRLNEKFSKMMADSFVPGYRPGKAPRKLIEKRYGKEVSDQLKAELLLQSLEQLAEDHKLNPIAQPNLDPFKIELPKEGPLEYEFDIEVAPEFEVPTYKGLRLKRPTKEITVADVNKATTRFLRGYGHLVPKDGAAEMDDHLLADISFQAEGRKLSDVKNISVRMDPQLAFKDGVVRDFGDKMKGIQAGEARQVDVQLAPTLSDPGLRGQTIQATFHVKEIKAMELPALDEEFLMRLGVGSEEALKSALRGALERQLEYEQRRAARAQVLEQIAAASSWELPRDLVARQARRTLQRKVLEMESAGFTQEDINSQARLLQQDALVSTERALKEHFVLQKIAEVEDLDVNDDDVAMEIEMMAEQSGESPRRVRARIEKDDLMESLMTQILERKALDLVLTTAEYEDVPYEPEAAVGAVEEQAVPGADTDITPPEAEAEEENTAEQKSE